MYPTHVINIGTEKSPWGEVVVLLVDNVRMLAFPDFIDDSNREALDMLYSTFEWPIGWPLNNINQFPPGKPLAGWDIIGAHRGKPFYDPADEDIMTGTTSTSEAMKDSNRSLQTVFDFAEKAIAKMNPPNQVKTRMQRLRALRKRCFNRGASRKNSSNTR